MGEPDPTLDAVDAIDDLVHKAPTVPLTGFCRVDAAELGEHAARLRAAVQTELDVQTRMVRLEAVFRR